MFYYHPEWPADLPVFDEPERAPEPPAYPPEAGRQPLVDENVRQLDNNETRIRLSTVQMHVEDIYTPGDRRLEAASRAARRPPHKRQAPRVGGFPCTIEGCGAKPFDRSCDLK